MTALSAQSLIALQVRTSVAWDTTVAAADTIQKSRLGRMLVPLQPFIGIFSRDIGANLQQIGGWLFR